MSSLRRRALQIGSVVLALGLLVLAFRGIDLGAVTEAFRQADYWWLIPLVGLVLASNAMRAWRWQLLIDALPDSSVRDDAPDASDLSTGTLRRYEPAFSSIMIGYMVNYAAPRMGEVARTANMAHRTPRRFSSLFGTVVSERIFDTVVLALAILSAGVLLIDRLPVVQREFLDPAWARLSGLSLPWILGGTATVVALGLAGSVWIWRALQNQQSALHHFWTNTLEPVLSSFRDGILTLVRSPKRGPILLSTVGMWTGYLLMAYLPFKMLGLAGPHGIGLVDAWILMAIGALGLLVPSPGGLGSYHYITIQALVHLYGMPEAPAASYAVLTHAAQMIFYTAIGGLVLLAQGTGVRALFGRGEEARG